MRFLPLLLSALFAVAADAQSTSGRHFHRDPRLPATPAASPVAEASARATTNAPLAKLRSGRPWPRYHFGRLPTTNAEPTARAVDAAHREPKTRRGFWRARR